jgi:hypothetical protein
MMGRREGRQKRWAEGKGAAKMGRREGGRDDGQEDQGKSRVGSNIV